MQLQSALQLELRRTTLSFALLLKGMLIIQAFTALAMYLFVVWHRLSYPFELEWIEGGILEQVTRIVHGQPVYVPPSLEFVPFLYPPLYFYVSAGVAYILGPGFLPLRLVSFIASLVCLATIFDIVRRETRNTFAALLAAGLFVGTFRLTGAWMDIARVDSLFLALFLVFVRVMRFSSSISSGIAAGIIAALAILTKQTALVVCVPIIAASFLTNWRRSIALVCSTAIVFGGITWLLNATSDGWYTFYIFDLLKQQTEWIPGAATQFWLYDLLCQLPVAISISVIFLIDQWQTRDYKRLLFWGAVLGGGLAGAFLTRIKIGGYDNVLLPGYAVIAIVFGMGIAYLLQAATTYMQGHIRVAMLYVAFSMQFIMVMYNPFAQIPSAEDLATGQQLVQMLAQDNTSVYMPYDGYLTTLAGRPTYAHHAATWDVMRGEEMTRGKAILTQSLTQAVHEQKFDTIILDITWNFLPDLDQYYVQTGEILQDNSAFYPVTGTRTRPSLVYTRRSKIR